LVINLIHSVVYLFLLIILYLDELIDIEVLQIIQKDHVNEFISKFPIGIKVKFTHKLQEWQKCNPIVNLPVNNLSSISVQHSTPPSIKICLQEVLNSTATGKMILDYYKINNTFNKSIKTFIG